MKILKKVLWILAIIIGLIVLLLIGTFTYIYFNSSGIEPPVISNPPDNSYTLQTPDTSIRTYGPNWVKKEQDGLYVLYTEGAPYERGLANGILTQDLIIAQEVAFVEQIKQMIPSEKYLKFLKYITGFLNRNLSEHVTSEYQQEIYGISLVSSDSFNWIGDKYSRQLNYHAAHDIGHALQSMMLVGCTSFAAWDGYTEDGNIWVGRNFDFWVGDDFAKNKVISFVRPDKGYPFAFVTWGAFIGVCSGMNMEGLTVTINAAKSSIPFSSATPVSLVAREILQYASTIDEAIAIAHKRTMFVSESFLVASAKDHKAVVIEKTPDSLAVYASNESRITCTNHFQSDYFAHDATHKGQKEITASGYRQERLWQLLNNTPNLNAEKVADILRDRKGTNDSNIGLGNEKAINQFIAHHAVIFRPDSLQMWVSNAPWQMGEFYCFDLNKIFKASSSYANSEIVDRRLTIKADSFLQSNAMNDFYYFRDIKLRKKLLTENNINRFVESNPNYYDTYRIAGDFYADKHKNDEAIKFYQQALNFEIATLAERKKIEEKITQLKSKKTSAKS